MSKADPNWKLFDESRDTVHVADVNEERHGWKRTDEVAKAIERGEQVIKTHGHIRVVLDRLIHSAGPGFVAITTLYEIQTDEADELELAIAADRIEHQERDAAANGSQTATDSGEE